MILVLVVLGVVCCPCFGVLWVVVRGGLAEVDLYGYGVDVVDLLDGEVEGFDVV